MSVLSSEVSKAVILCKTSMKVTNYLHEKWRPAKTLCHGSASLHVLRKIYPSSGIPVVFCPALAFGWSRIAFGRWRISLPLFLVPLDVNGLLDNLCCGSRKQGGEALTCVPLMEFTGTKITVGRNQYSKSPSGNWEELRLFWESHYFETEFHCLSVYAISSPFVQLRPGWSSWQQQSQLLGINFITNISI